MSLAARARAYHIAECRPYLDALLDAARRVEPLYIPVQPDFPEWKLRQALVACDKYPTEFDGHYAGLRDKVEVGFRMIGSQLHIRATSKIMTVEAIRAAVEAPPPPDDAALLARLVQQMKEAPPQPEPERPSVFDLIKRGVA